MHQLAAERILAGEEVGQADQPVYLSRRLLPIDRRAIVGEQEFEDVLRENGFLIAYPERMTLRDQIRLVNRHQDIFAAEGSAAHAILFSLGGRRLRLHLFSSHEPRNDYYLVSAASKTPTTFVNCVGTRDRQLRNVVNSPRALDMATACDYLKHLGLLKKRLRARLAQKLTMSQESYDEAFTYDMLRWGKSPSDALLAEASELAGTSWLLSFSLATWYLNADVERATELATQFTRLVKQERDLDRLARYAPDIGRMVPPWLKPAGQLLPNSCQLPSRTSSDWICRCYFAGITRVRVNSPRGCFLTAPAQGYVAGTSDEPASPWESEISAAGHTGTRSSSDCSAMARQ